MFTETETTTQARVATRIPTIGSTPPEMQLVDSSMVRGSTREITTRGNNPSAEPISRLEQLEAYRRLGLAILEQAVLDIKMCKRARVIIDGKPVKAWPKRFERTPQNNFADGRIRVSNHFDSRTRVQEIVEWVYSEDCKTLIELVGAPIEQEHLINLLTESQSDYRNKSIQRTV